MNLIDLHKIRAWVGIAKKARIQHLYPAGLHMRISVNAEGITYKPYTLVEPTVTRPV